MNFYYSNQLSELFYPPIYSDKNSTTFKLFAYIEKHSIKIDILIHV